MSGILNNEEYVREKRKECQKRLQLSKAHVEFATRDLKKFPGHAQARANLVRAKADLEIAMAFVHTWSNPL